MTIDPVNIAEKFAAFEDAWNPRIIAACNGNEVRVAKLRGPFVWHAHEGADELFLVVEGAMLIGIREPGAMGKRSLPVDGDRGHGQTEFAHGTQPDTIEREEVVRAGELIVIPAGVEHRPASEPEGSICSVLLISRAGEVNTGNAAGTPEAAALTRDALERI